MSDLFIKHCCEYIKLLTGANTVQINDFVRLTTLVAGSRTCHFRQNWVLTNIGVHCTAMSVQVFTRFYVPRNISRMLFISIRAKTMSFLTVYYKCSCIVVQTSIKVNVI